MLLLIGFLNSCTSRLDNFLTEYSWELSKIIVLPSGIEDSTAINHKISWDFKNDYSYEYEKIFDSQRQFYKGDWELNDNRLLMINDLDTIKVTIEKITNKEMIWVLSGEDSARCYLYSKPKKAIIPTFPTNKEGI